MQLFVNTVVPFLYLVEEILCVLIYSRYRRANRNLLQPNPVTLATEEPITTQYQNGSVQTGEQTDRCLYLQDSYVGALGCRQDVTSSYRAKRSFNFQKTPHDGLIIEFLQTQQQNPCQQFKSYSNAIQEPQLSVTTIKLLTAKIQKIILLWSLMICWKLWNLN